MLTGMGIETGVDLARLAAAGRMISAALGRRRRPRWRKSWPGRPTAADAVAYAQDVRRLRQRRRSARMAGQSRAAWRGVVPPHAQHAQACRRDPRGVARSIGSSRARSGVRQRITALDPGVDGENALLPDPSSTRCWSRRCARHAGRCRGWRYLETPDAPGDHDPRHKDEVEPDAGAHAEGIAGARADLGDAGSYERHCERSEAIQPSVRRHWIASLR